jgi:hypothetical protein
VAHLEEADGSHAMSSLKAYFFKHAFTGSSFETFCDEDPNTFTANDIVAVSMLSVNIPPSASRWILGEGRARLGNFLREIDAELTISSPIADLGKKSSAWQLWNEIHSLRDVGETKTSKLLATKRPFLFPIFDRHVSAALQISPNSYWKPWQQFMQSEVGNKAARTVTQMAASLNKSHLSPLRLLDVVIWMRQHGYRFITKKLVDEGKMICVKYADPT